jgi:hypothetical protein
MKERKIKLNFGGKTKEKEDEDNQFSGLTVL